MYVLDTMVEEVCIRYQCTRCSYQIPMWNKYVLDTNVEDVCIRY